MIYILLTFYLGGAVVCAEAGGESWEDRVAVAAVIRNRVDAGRGDAIKVMMARGQFAKPCGVANRRKPTRRDLLAFTVGFMRLHRFDWLTPKVLSFCTHKAARRVGRTWRRRGLRPASTHLAHIFWSHP